MMNDHSTARFEKPQLAPIVPFGSEIDVRRYVRALLAARMLLVAVALASGILGLAIAWLTSPLYQATATLAVSQSKIGEPGFGGVITSSSFVPLVRNYNIAVAVIQKFKLDAKPYNLTPSLFLDRTLSVTDVRNTNLLIARAALPDAQLAANVVNDVAAQAVVLSHRLNQEEAIRGRDIVGKQVAELRERLQASETRLLKYKNESQVDLLKGEVETLVEQNSWLPRLGVSIASERARLTTGEQDLQKRTPKNEAETTAYAALDNEVAHSRGELAALEKERNQLLHEYRLGAGQLSKLRELNEKETTLDRLKLEYDLAKAAYTAAAAQFENATLKVASRSAELQLIDPAFPADRPVSPRPLRSLLTWMLVGLIGVSIAVLVTAGLAAQPR
jgi:uncharacterized protein involved in exopolysaccharide biosynthesis